MCRIRDFLSDFDDDYAIISRKKLILREKKIGGWINAYSVTGLKQKE